MKFCNGEDKVCKYFLTYNGRKCCMNETIKGKWSKKVQGISVGNILKAYLKQGGECKFYDGRARKENIDG